MLGHAQTYRAEIRATQSGGLWTTVEALAEVSWGRTLDDYSEASIVVAKENATDRCCNLLGQVRTWGHELAIYRDDEFVWQGPITQKSEFRSRFEFSARDMLAWFDRRRNTRPYQWVQPTEQQPHGLGSRRVDELLREIIADATGQADPWRGGVFVGDIPARGTLQAEQRYEKNLGDLIRDLLGYGVDAFTIGRQVFFVDEATSQAHTPRTLHEDDFLADLEVREIGLDGATRAAVVGQQPQLPVGQGGVQQPSQLAAPVGVYPASGGVEPFFGLLFTGHQSTTATDEQACRDLARIAVAYGNPPPVSIVVPANTQLSPEAPISVHDIVPGRRVRVLLDSYYTPAQQDFLWNELSVRANVTGEGMAEQVQVSVTSKGSAVVGDGRSPADGAAVAS